MLEKDDSVSDHGNHALHAVPQVVCLFVDKFNISQNQNLKWKDPDLNDYGCIRLFQHEGGGWCLDKGGPHPMLGITRRQLPFAPAFANTAHSAHGQTFGSGAIVGFDIGGSSSAVSNFVAFTFVQRRKDLLIAF